jgi:hypothetical protein
MHSIILQEDEVSILMVDTKDEEEEEVRVEAKEK